MTVTSKLSAQCP